MNPLRWDVLIAGFVLAVQVLMLGLRGDLSADDVAVRVDRLTKVFGRRAKEAADKLADGWSRDEVAKLGTAVDQSLAEAGLPPERVDRVFLTGGTSLVPAVRGIFEARFGAAKVAGGGEFVSVAEGLALIGRARG